MNERLRDALQRAASSEPGVGDAYARFEIARRRANVARGIVVLVVTVAVAMSFLYVLPNPFRGGRTAPFHAGGTLNPDDSFANRYTDDVVGFEMNYPLTWDATGAPGEVAYFAIPGDGDAYEIQRCEACTDVLLHPTRFMLRLEPVRAGDFGSRARQGARLEAVGADVSRGETFEVAGRRVTVFEYVFPTAGHPAFQDFCVDCALVEYVIRWPGGWVIDVMAMAPDATTMGFYRLDAARVVRTIQRLIARPYDD